MLVNKPLDIDIDKCWASHKRVLGNCLRNVRPGKLTCWQHQHLEKQAQKLKAVIENFHKGW